MAVPASFNRGLGNYKTYDTRLESMLGEVSGQWRTSRLRDNTSNILLSNVCVCSRRGASLAVINPFTEEPGTAEREGTFTRLLNARLIVSRSRCKYGIVDVCFSLLH